MTWFSPELNAVPVLKVTSFAPETDADQEDWVKLALSFNNVLHSFNWTYAIVDVNKNGYVLHSHNAFVRRIT